MATKYSLDILDAETREWTTVALFSDILPLTAMVDMACSLWVDTSGAADLAVLDMDTGEVLWNAADAQEYDYEICNEDMGFDPYLGCYTDDC